MCIPLRLGIGTILFFIPEDWLIYVGIPVSLLSAGFVTVTLLGWLGRMGEYGRLGGRRWWAFLRPFHALLWILAATLLFLSSRAAGAILISDALLSALARPLLTHAP